MEGLVRAKRGKKARRRRSRNFGIVEGPEERRGG